MTLSHSRSAGAPDQVQSVWETISERAQRPYKTHPPVGTENPSEHPAASSILIHEVKSVPGNDQSPENPRLLRIEGVQRLNRKFATWLGGRHPNSNVSFKLGTCGHSLVFRDYYRHPERPVKLSGGIFCQMPLLCPFCASGRASRHVMTIKDKLTQRLTEERDLVPYMVTLTAKSDPDLPAMIAKIWDAQKALVQRRRNALKGKNQETIMGQIDGGFLSGECKRGKGGHGWHYHLHGIMLGPGGLYQPMWERLKNEWAELLGQESASVQFQPIRGYSQMRLGRDPKECSFVPDLLEVIKYAITWEDQTYEDRLHAALCLHRVRSLRCFGSFYGLKLSDEVTDDLSGLELHEYIELVYRFLGDGYQLQRSTQCEPMDGDSYETFR